VGKLISIKDGSGVDITNDTGSVGYKNPYRYRGYRYDTETGLYYLNSRYYNPGWGRFINEDAYFGLVGELLSSNMFTYCKNNPVTYADPNGYGILDFAFLAMDAAALLSQPSWGNAGWVLLDVAFLFDPTDISGTVAHVAKAAHLVEETVHEVEEVSGAVKLGERMLGTHAGLVKSHANDSHHIIQHAAVKDISRYNRNAAPAIQLKGPSTTIGTEHYLATQSQRNALAGGTYGAERRVSYRALREAGLSVGEAKGAVRYADKYFMGELGMRLDTPTLIPGNRYKLGR
jgi:RHS repeat-associated core domain